MLLLKTRNHSAGDTVRKMRTHVTDWEEATVSSPAGWPVSLELERRSQARGLLGIRVWATHGESQDILAHSETLAQKHGCVKIPKPEWEKQDGS